LQLTTKEVDMDCCSTKAGNAPAGVIEGAAVRDVVRARYARAAERAVAGGPASCCDDADTDQITGDLYAADDVAPLPAGAVQASLGCGNPTALAELRPGETVLDLGSGGGIDVLLSARRVGPTGFAYGLDMADEMLALARENARQAGATNVAFLKGEIERVPLPDRSVDVVISNCVINLSADKAQVLREAFRVLRPGGRFAVSDVVSRGPIPERFREDAAMWAGCISGALEESEYRRLLAAAGFEAIEIESTREYRTGDLLPGIGGEGAADGLLFGAFVRARRPTS
jgi:arsenite methyltransferase